MRVSKEQERYYISIMRRFLMTRPDASLIDIQRCLERNVGHKFVPNYISKLRKKLMNASIHQFDAATEKKFAAHFADFSNELLSVVSGFVFGTDLEPTSRIVGARAALDMKIEQIKMLKALGVFKNAVAKKEDGDVVDIPPVLAEGFLKMMGGWSELMTSKEKQFIEGKKFNRPKNPWWFNNLNKTTTWSDRESE